LKFTKVDDDDDDDGSLSDVPPSPPPPRTVSKRQAGNLIYIYLIYLLNNIKYN